MIDNDLRDPEYRKAYQQEKLILDITVIIAEALELQGISYAALAERLGTSETWVTAMLEGSIDLPIRCAADVLTALGLELCIGHAPILAVDHE